MFDDTLRQGLSVQLQQSPFLSLISEQQVQQTLALMGQPKDARLTAEIAQQVCERTASAAVLEGSIASLGSQYVLGLRARNCSTGGILDQEQIQAARREDVLNALSQIARTFRTRVGESLATVEKHSTPLAEATTSSLEALKAFSTAMKVGLPPGSRGHALLRRAVEIDPNFAHGICAVWGLPTAGSESRCSQPRARQKPGSCASAPASGKGSSSLQLRSPGDGQSGKSVPDTRTVGADLSSPCGTSGPRGALGGLSTKGPDDWR